MVNERGRFRERERFRSQIKKATSHHRISVDLFDGIIGARGRLGFGNSPWFVPYYIDVGAGSSDLTWQGAVGVGYGFRWGDIVFSYKYLYYDVGDDKFIQELKLGGFAIGANFRF